MTGVEDSRRRILDRLRRSAGGQGVEELADQVGLHVNTVRFHLDRLIGEGLVHRGATTRATRGRPRLVYTATPGPDLGRGDRDYRLLAEMVTGLLADAVPDPEARARALGRGWGSGLARPPEGGGRATEEEGLAELVRVLDDVGFAPEASAAEDGIRVLLRHCPFLEVAEAHPRIVCSLHLGLIEGVLAKVRSPVSSEQLVPFAEPAGCVSRLGRRQAPAG